MRKRVALLLGSTLAALSAPAPVPAAAALVTVADGVGACRFIRQLDMSKLVDAPGQVTATTSVAADKDTPAYCEVRGYVAPHTGFAFRLPLQWNGKLLMQGCGGFCGSVSIDRANDALRQGYATASTDMGHASTALDGKWALDNSDAVLDFGYRATHAATVAAKALVRAFYKQAARLNYFRGCSTGGRQAMVEAERFPDDYDGIIAGAPVLYYGRGAGLQLMWSVRANLDAQNRPILDRPAIELLAANALRQCDAKDGLKDGVIAAPRQCRLDLAPLACSAASTPGSCLSPAQIDAARKIYAGPSDSQGRPLTVGGVEPGSEPNWIPAYVGVDGNRAEYESFIADLFRYIVFDRDPGADWQPADLNFDTDPGRLGGLEAVIGGGNPDLRRFKARGGKLIGYHGWRDQSVVPMTSVDFHALVTRAMGGPGQTDDFYRLFMVAGMNHCMGGTGADGVDWLGALDTWVETGRAPERLVATRSDAKLPPMSRPLYPYPLQARYVGRGDPNVLTSWKPSLK